MINRRSKSFLLVLVVVLSLVLSGCGKSSSASNGVPNRTVELVVLDYFDERELYPGDYNGYSFNVVHNYDKSSKTDAAIINLSIEYTYTSESTYIQTWYSYDKSSDLWTLIRKGEWSESSYGYPSDRLIGQWHIDDCGDYFENHYEININSISGHSVSLDYSISASAMGAAFGPGGTLYLDGSGTYEVYPSWGFSGPELGIQVPIDLPDGFFISSLAEGSSNSTTLCIDIDLQQGCYDGSLLGTLYYSAP